MSEAMTLEGLPTSISHALTNYWSATFDCGMDAVNLDAISPRNTARHDIARKALVEAIKADRAFLCNIGRPTLPASDTITLEPRGKEALDGMLVLDLEPSDAQAVPSATELAAKFAPRFRCVFCSQCGQAFGPGDSGFSHCSSHRSLRALTALEELATGRPA